MTTTLRPLNWSQRVTLAMFGDQRGGHMDTKGMGIPGGTIRSLRARGLIEPRSWFRPATEWTLTREGWATVRQIEEDGGA